jgi:hypothetical protein
MHLGGWGSGTMPNIVKLAGMTLALALAGHYAHAAEPTVVNLSCDGTDAATLDPTMPSPVKKMGLVINLAEHTVSGFSVVAHISYTDDATVLFDGESTDLFERSSSATGSIDRVTGVTRAHTAVISKDKKLLSADDWDLVCKVTNRLF